MGLRASKKIGDGNSVSDKNLILVAKEDDGTNGLKR